MPRVKAMVRFFGMRWDYPDLDHDAGHAVIQVSAPVGQSCLWCAEQISDGDRGLLRPVPDDPDTIAPIHAECEIRMMLGSPAHLRRQCACHNKGVAEAPYPGTARQQAQETVAILNARRAALRMHPLW